MLTSRFPRFCRRQILAVLERSSRLEDLAQSFPGLLFALATGFGSAALRARAEVLVTEGAPLKAVAAALGLPWWLRRLPPDAFGDRLPALPAGSDFAFAITSLVPSDPQAAGAWLARVGTAAEACGPELALWMARQRRMPASLPEHELELMVAAWAWHSMRTGTPGHELVRAPWTGAMSFKRALAEASSWMRRVDLAVTLEAGIADTWYPAGCVSGFDIVPLATLADFLSESEMLDNCLDQYASQIRSGTTRLFSIRRAGVRMATMEISAHEDDSLVPRITQLRGPRNKRAAPEVWQAALLWLSGQRFRPLTTATTAGVRAQRQRAVRKLWQPYLAFLPNDRLRGRIEALVLAISEPASDRGRATATRFDRSRAGGR